VSPRSKGTYPKSPGSHSILNRDFDSVILEEGTPKVSVEH
jgi:hypothetical protein